MSIATDPEHEVASKVEVLNDLEGDVGVLMESHERKRELWFPSELLGPSRTSAPTSSSSSCVPRPRGFPTTFAQHWRSTC